MATKKYTYTFADGRVAKRRSARVYTHVVIGCENLAWCRRNAESKDWADSHKRAWLWLQNCAKTEVGQPYPGERFAVDQRMHDKALEEIAHYKDEADFVAARVAKAIAAINERGTGEVGPEVVLQWSMSEANARKGMSAKDGYWTNLRIAPVDAT